MLELDNRTDWSAALYPGWGRDGQRRQTLVFKAGYSFDADGRLSALPFAPIEEADRYAGDPGTSGLAAAGETAPFKKGGELLLYGSAQPGGPGRTVIHVRVGLRRKNDAFWRKELRVFGPRSWRRKLLAAMPGPPQAIDQPVPLVYENAYGGADPSNPDQYFAANPAGVGFSVRGFRTKGLTLPQIECGPGFIAGPADRPAPAGFGPLAPHWAPRCNQKIEIDEQAVESGGCPWRKEPPEDLYNAAPLDQRFEEPFEGELSLMLQGLVADAPREVLINMPEVRPLLSFKGRPAVELPPPRCDTLVIDTDRRQIHRIWRTALPMDIENPAHGSIVLRDPAAEAQQSADEQPKEALPT
jgi:hypothetical protein